MHNHYCGDTTPSCSYFHNQGGPPEWSSTMTRQENSHFPQWHIRMLQNKHDSHHFHYPAPCVQRGAFSRSSASAPTCLHHCPPSRSMRSRNREDALHNSIRDPLGESPWPMRMIIILQKLSVLCVLCAVVCDDRCWVLQWIRITWQPARITWSYAYWHVRWIYKDWWGFTR